MIDDRRERIVWAVDPASDGACFGGETLFLLRDLAGSGEIVVEPVHVAERERAGPRLETLRDLLRDKGMSALAPAIIVEPDGPAPRDRARALLEHAESRDARLVVLTTHARKGLERLVVGSFTEAVLREAEIPVLVAHAASGGPVRTIFLVSDRKDEATLAPAELLPLARRLGAAVRHYPIEELELSELLAAAAASPHSLIALHVRPGFFASGITRADLCALARRAERPVLVLPEHAVAEDRDALPAQGGHARA